MKLLILNGNPEPSGFDDGIDAFASAARKHGHETETVPLRELSIKSCNGCWTCWWATPGRCVHDDGVTGLYPRIVASDILVWASPLVMGNVSAITRETQDRIIPLIHPYIELVKGECHHRKRYERMPDFGLVIAFGPDDTREDADIVRRQHERLALNARSDFRFMLETTGLDEEAIDAALAS